MLQNILQVQKAVFSEINYFHKAIDAHVVDVPMMLCIIRNFDSTSVLIISKTKLASR